MRKSIYDEALLKLREIAEKLTRKQWFELTNNIELIRRNLQQGQKQEKLLELYKELSNYVDEQTYAHELPEITRLKIIIQEIENDKNGGIVE